MAKRKRLSPANPAATAAPAPKRAALAPIAQVAGETAATSALADVTQALESARRDGRMIETLPLDAINTTHLVRDRIGLEEEEQTVLKRSLAARGQQTPIEVVALDDGYGLVSGWRRLSALKALLAETGDDRFASVQARIVAPEGRAEAYVAMVEENEIRAGLSFYERARIVWKAQEDGAYPTRRAALQGLFGAVPRAKRSKIGSFVTLVEAFDGALRFPAGISEKLGLRLVKAMEADSSLAARLRKHLARGEVQSVADEMAVIQDVLRPPALLSVPTALAVRFDAKRARIEITGADETLYTDLQRWLSGR